MSAQIDVLAVLDAEIACKRIAVANGYSSEEVLNETEETRDAVAELVEADREYDAAYAAVGELRDGVSTIGEVVHAEVALRRAQSRRATALARCGVAK
ncbi:MAG TPA: hypothetical protein VN612_16900 [Acidobacteriaceae bacterium]|nr:hypothetical protein [Acidobacteriaceae bacterium]